MFYGLETTHTQGYATLTILVAPFLMTKAALVSDGANTQCTFLNCADEAACVYTMTRHHYHLNRAAV